MYAVCGGGRETSIRGPVCPGETAYDAAWTGLGRRRRSPASNR